jgi:hypothetical protein
MTIQAQFTQTAEAMPTEPFVPIPSATPEPTSAATATTPPTATVGRPPGHPYLPDAISHPDPDICFHSHGQLLLAVRSPARLSVSHHLAEPASPTATTLTPVHPEK